MSGTTQPKRQVIWLNGAFGVGKTTVARKLAAVLPDAMTLDPEEIGGMLCKVIPAAQRSADFQDLRAWRRLTVATIEGVLQDHPGLLLVPMTVADSTYFQAPRFATHLVTDNRSAPEVAAAVRRLASI